MIKIITVVIFTFIVFYLIYEFTIGWILCFYKDNIKEFNARTSIVLRKPKVILNLSYGIVINGVFGIINTTGVSIIIYILLTFIGLVGIINTAEND